MRYGVILGLTLLTVALALAPAPNAQALSWSTTTVDAAGVKTSYAIAVDANGDHMIAYRDDTLLDLRFAICDLSGSANGNCDQTADWVTTLVDAKAPEWISMKLDGSGNPMLSYNAFIGGGDGELRFAVCERSLSANGNCNLGADWDKVVVDATDLPTGLGTSIEVDPSGDPMISYYSQFTGDLKFAICERSVSVNGNCNQAADWSTVTPDSTPVSVGATSIAVDASGNPMIAYNSSGDLKFAFCQRSLSINGNCDQAGDWGTATLLAPSPFAGGVSITVDASGNPMVAYAYDVGAGTNLLLGFAFCQRSLSMNGNCNQAADWSTATLETTTGLFLFIGSIAVDPNGDPMISYDVHVTGDADVKFVICDRSASTNGNCNQAGDWDLETALAAGVTHSETLSVNINGDPIIAYTEETAEPVDRDVKFATAPLGTADDFDSDGVHNADEGPCGADPLDPGKQPERLDTPGDDDGDTVANEGLPSPVSDAFDCDGDGWPGNQENLIFNDAPSTARDQDPCGNNGWASDLAGNNNIVNIQDLNSFLSPTRPDDGHGVFNKFGHPLDDTTPVPDAIIDAGMARWNLQTPPHFATITINIGDLNALITGAVGSPARPPMFGGLPAFFTNGGMCPYPP